MKIFSNFTVRTAFDSLVERDGEDAKMRICKRGFPASPDGGGGAIEWRWVWGHGVVISKFVVELA